MIRSPCYCCSRHECCEVRLALQMWHSGLRLRIKDSLYSPYLLHWTVHSIEVHVWGPSTRTRYVLLDERPIAEWPVTGWRVYIELWVGELWMRVRRLSTSGHFRCVRSRITGFKLKELRQCCKPKVNFVKPLSFSFSLCVCSCRCVGEDHITQLRDVIQLQCAWLSISNVKFVT